MNIFVLDKDPVIAANMMCDKHVVKMIVESCQLLSTAHRILDGHQSTHIGPSGRLRKTFFLSDPDMESRLCKYVMPNHPCSIWTRNSSTNYKWLTAHNLALCNEYTRRYNKTHAMQDLANTLDLTLPIRIPLGPITSFPQAMPEGYRCDDPVEAYRAYYCFEKSRFAKWKTGGAPEWYTHFHEELKEISQ